jgi:O-methyltransferase involved in polyketide biosynthesis
MTEKQAGLMAIAMAYSRAFHTAYESPKIFDEFLADALLSPVVTIYLVVNEVTL